MQSSIDTAPHPVDSSSKKIQTKSEDVILISKDDSRYNALRQGFNKRIDKHPQVIALCKNTNGVVEAVKYARQNKLDVTIKSGGHSFEGFSCNDGGMMINLSMMNTIDWIDEATINVSPGCTLSQLYDELLPKKKIIPGGSCAGVGISGLVLGGGYGFFSRKYGLTCDSLLEVTLVDGKGEVHSSRDDEKLLWACRGGGNGNFGVVTKMKFQTFPAPVSFTSHHLKSKNLDAGRAAKILEDWFTVAAQLPQSCFSAFVLNGKTLNILITNYEAHNASVQSALDELSAFTDSVTKGIPQELSRALKNFYGRPGPIYFKNASAGLYSSFSDVRNVITEVLDKVINSHGIIYHVNTLGGKISDPQFEAVSCFPHRSKSFLSELQTYYDSPAVGSKLVATFEEIQQLIKNNGITSQYCNYPDLHFENWQHAYYGDNYLKLQEMKRRYDPENLFRHEQSIII